MSELEKYLRKQIVELKKDHQNQVTSIKEEYRASLSEQKKESLERETQLRDEVANNRKYYVDLLELERDLYDSDIKKLTSDIVYYAEKSNTKETKFTSNYSESDIDKTIVVEPEKPGTQEQLEFPTLPKMPKLPSSTLNKNAYDPEKDINGDND